MEDFHFLSFKCLAGLEDSGQISVEVSHIMSSSCLWRGLVTACQCCKRKTSQGSICLNWVNRLLLWHLWGCVLWTVESHVTSSLRTGFVVIGHQWTTYHDIFHWNTFFPYLHNFSCLTFWHLKWPYLAQIFYLFNVQTGQIWPFTFLLQCHSKNI